MIQRKFDKDTSIPFRRLYRAHVSLMLCKKEHA